MDEYAARLQAKLAPESVIQTLIRAGCLLSAYELIKSEVVDGVRGFYASGFKGGKQLYDETRYAAGGRGLCPSLGGVLGANGCRL